MKRILFVCMGNICRSPEAEAILKAKVAECGRSADFFIDSAGTYGGHVGSLPDFRMRQHAAKRGYVLDSRSRQVYPSADFEAFDLIVCMDDRNLETLQRMTENGEELAKIRKMTDYCRKFIDYTEIPDPYYGGEQGFELVLDLLEDAAEGMLEQL